jgi:maltoporin
MDTEQLEITTHHSWNITAPGTVILNLTNSGSGKVTLSAVECSGNPATYNIAWSDGTADDTIDPGEKTSITITRGSAFQAGVTYNFVVLTASGKRFGPYVATAPS